MCDPGCLTPPTYAAIGVAGTVLAAISKDEHEKAKFMSRRKFETDMTSNLLTVEARGQLNEKRNTARRMKQANAPIETIAQFTELSVAEIEKL